MAGFQVEPARQAVASIAIAVSIRGEYLITGWMKTDKQPIDIGFGSKWQDLKVELV